MVRPTVNEDPAADRRLDHGLSEAIAAVRRAVRSSHAHDAHPELRAQTLSGLEALEAEVRKVGGRGGLTHPRGLTAIVGQPFVAIVGIDRFHGLREEMGDSFAEAVVQRVRQRITDTVSHAHLGRVNRASVEFTFFAVSNAEAHEALVRLHAVLERTIELPERPVALDVTIGFAGREHESDALEWLVERAEHALARAHATSAKVAEFTARDRIERTERLALLRDLRMAVERSELFLCYQPKLDLKSGAIESVEALVRWRHPVRGLVRPDQFVGLAEEADEIRRITEAVIEQSLADQEQLAAEGMALVVHVNVSGRLLPDEDFALWALARIGERGAAIGFEITETAVIANPERAMANIHAFARAGIAISIDDYGSGLSSLAYLKQIPAHELKIDREFVSGLTSSHRDPLLVRSTIDLAHALDMKVTAEGVDNPMALALLQVMGCDMVQGYHLSKPLLVEELRRFLRDFSPAQFIRLPARRA